MMSGRIARALAVLVLLLGGVGIVVGHTATPQAASSCFTRAHAAVAPIAFQGARAGARAYQWPDPIARSPSANCQVAEDTDGMTWAG